MADHQTPHPPQASRKRGRPLREVPADFDQRFREHGWAGTAAHYNTGDPQVKRWLEERDQQRLTNERASFLRERRRLRDRERRKQYR